MAKLLLNSSRDLKVGDLILRIKDGYGWYGTNYIVKSVDIVHFMVGGFTIPHDSHVGNVYEVEREVVADSGYEELVILAKDMRIGDIKIDARRAAGGNWHDRGKRMVVTSIVGDKAYYDNGANFDFLDIRYEMKILRPVASAPSDRWNDKCPECKGNIYKGFLQIEHEKPCR